MTPPTIGPMGVLLLDREVETLLSRGLVLVAPVDEVAICEAEVVLSISEAVSDSLDADEDTDINEDIDVEDGRLVVVDVENVEIGFEDDVLDGVDEEVSIVGAAR